MYYNNVLVILVVYSVFAGLTFAKKSKKLKPARVEESESFQPDVVSYSTFGFNDVGTYDGFVPSSPDYTSFLTGIDQESTTRLYGPAFPTALDSTGYSNSYAPNQFSEETLESNQNVGPNTGMLQYSQNSANFFGGPSPSMNDDQNKNFHKENFIETNTEDLKKPIYGTKLRYKTKTRPKQFNNTELNIFSSSHEKPSSNNFFGFSDVSSTFEDKPSHSQANLSYPSFDIYSQDHHTSGVPSYQKPTSVYGSLNFPRVVDFTNINQFDTTDVDIESPSISKPFNLGFNTIYTNQNENSFANFLNHNNHKIKHDSKNNKTKPYNDETYFQNISSDRAKNYTSGSRPATEPKKKVKKPWSAANYTNYYKNWKDLSLKGYQYSTNNSHTSFKYNSDDYKRESDNNEDEVKPASSNLIDYASYQLPESDFQKFNVKPEPDFTKIKPVVEEEYTNYQPAIEKLKQDEYNDQFQSYFSTPPTTTTSYWGNSFRQPEYFSFKNHQHEPQLNDDLIDEIVTIPRAPPKSVYNKLQDTKFTEWSYGSQRPHRPSKPGKELFTRFKSEEDLLGLRNHDTSHPSYLPTFYPNLPQDENSGYRNLVNRWRESYLKAKYKDSTHRDYEKYASETKAVHVPMPRPYPIEIPHPVIVPVPQPFPVRVPVSKPVAVPVMQEIIVPIEKPVPYPVFKDIPYPIEKPVPVRVEKEVKVPVPKPYPVEVPYVRPVFHHTKPHDDIEADLDENDYYPQSSKNIYRKRPYRQDSSRNRPRRPSRTIYERNRRRWPEHRRPAPSNSDEGRRRPSTGEMKHKYHEFQPEFEDNRDYYYHCKRTKSC